MKIKLNTLEIENFKGLKQFFHAFEGENAVIKGENGTGKTTVYDALLWILFGKDCTGRIATGKGAFGIHPTDSTGKTIKGLVTCVIATIQFGDKTHELRKELHERLGKGKQVKGYEVKCKIDEVDKTIGEYKDWLAERLDEDTFKLLTDTQYFNNDDKFPWKKRRDVLLEIAGEDIGTPEGFEELLVELNDRTMDDYSKVLKTRKKTLVEKQKEINPRIDELQKQVKDYAGGDTTELETQRGTLVDAIAVQDTLRQGVLDSQNDRVVALELIDKTKSERTVRETALTTDTSGTKKYTDEKTTIVLAIANKKQEIQNTECVIQGKKAGLESTKQIMTTHNFALGNIRTQYKTLSEADLTGETCDVCGHQLPADMIADIAAKTVISLKELAKSGDEFKAKRNACRDTLEKVGKEIDNFNIDLEKLNIELQEATTASDERMPKLNKMIAGNVTLDPKGDEEWKALNAKILELEDSLGEAPSDQLTEIETNRKAKSEELKDVEESLKASDQLKANGERIAELETEEKEIGQKVTALEKQIANVAAYKKAESLLVEAAVNDKFKHVKFRLFKELLKQGEDGEQETEPTCEATLNGIPYGDMSTGQKILVGVDIINVLCKHYGVEPVLFVDNFESMTLPLEANSQVIKLCAVDGVKELEVV